MIANNFENPTVSTEEIAQLQELARLARGDVLKMTTIAGCGHPGGSMSSLEMYTLLWNCVNVDPQNPHKDCRDRIVVSHGHTSPGVYSVLGRKGFFPVDEMIAHFRQAGSCFAGHVEQCVPGVDWDTGNLGQGLSAAVGFALAREVRGMDYRVFCLMGDGEQQKGQIAEARRTAVKFGLKNLTAFVDLNLLQINGETHVVMPQNIVENWASDGWDVIEVDGHDFQALYAATRQSLLNAAPTVIIAKTIMGHGVSFMENDAHWHGVVLSDEKCRDALAEMNLTDDLDALRAKRAEPQHMKMADFSPMGKDVHVCTGTPRTYAADEKLDNRGAWGNAIADIAEANSTAQDTTPVAILDCDLQPSVKTAGFEKILPNNFFQCGIQEHNTATIAGAMSVTGVQTFWADFGVFGVDETYNQHRLSVLNHAHPKIICTHCGLDVGEDGKTHQCIDYIGLFRNLLGMELVVPADPNQTDRATRYIAQTAKPSIMVMGRSKLPTITADDGTPFFAGGYTFEYGKADLVRTGTDAAIIVTGTLCANAVAAHDLLKDAGISTSVIIIATPLAPDVDAIRAAAGTGTIITVEDHLVTSGLGSIVSEVLAENKAACTIRKLGVTAYASSGTPAELFANYNCDPAGIAATVKDAIGA